MTPWLIMLGVYFGRWPAWIELFVESCKRNRDVRWLIYTDCGAPENRADNVRFVHTTLADYSALVRERLGVDFRPADAYKLCDLRPCLGHIHEREIDGVPFFGYGDFDVIYGRIASCYGEGGSALADLDVVSTHGDLLAGHFAVFRNTEAIRRAYARVPQWRALIEKPAHTHFDEKQFSDVFRHSATERVLFAERCCTVLSPRRWHDGTMNYPRRWFWRDGRLTNEFDGAREFLYLHFMRWQSRRWAEDPPQPGEGAWGGRDIMRVDWRRAAVDGFCISPDGFTAIPPAEA
jgi:hypothetical protein